MGPVYPRYAIGWRFDTRAAHLAASGVFAQEEEQKKEREAGERAKLALKSDASSNNYA